MSIRLFREGDARARIAKPIVVAVLSFSCAVAIAQQRPDAGQLLEQQREPLRLPPPEDDVRPRPPEPRPALPVSPTLKVRVTQFTFSGNTLYSDQELAEVVKEFIGKVTGNESKEMAGSVERKLGKVQKAAGEAADEIRDAVKKP